MMMGMGEVRFASALKWLAAFAGTLAVLLLLAPHSIQGQQRPTVSELLRQFDAEDVFWRQFNVAKAIVAENDKSVLAQLEPRLMHADRHVRGNAAFIFAGLGDPRGFETIRAILDDHSENRVVQARASNRLPWVKGQIASDRYYAAHLLGDLKDPRAVPLLVSLLRDDDVSYIVPWSLGQIGDPAAISPLTGLLSDADPSLRILAIYGLVDLKAAGAVPRLRQLLADDAKSNFDKQESVGEAARAAIAKLQPEPVR